MDATIACVCPLRGDAPQHEQDTITFRERLDFHAGLTVRQAIKVAKTDDPDLTAGEVLAILSEHYLVFGIEGWTLRDARGKPVEVSKPAIRALLEDHPIEAMDLVDEADNLYQEQVLLPLLARASGSSQPSPNPEPTSATPASSATKSPSRKRRSRSSTSTTRTDDTATITSLHGGDSKSSPSSATAA